MKIAGWICTILGVVSFLGAVVAGNNPLGPTFWLALGIFLLYRANEKNEDGDRKLK